jgi:hypothetical protein
MLLGRLESTLHIKRGTAALEQCAICMLPLHVLASQVPSSEQLQGLKACSLLHMPLCNNSCCCCVCGSDSSDTAAAAACCRSCS